MRLWSIHPQYLDTRGLTACWRETLLARKVLQGKTKGYKNHPQLKRFKALRDPLKAINLYLATIFLEAKRRNYNFDWKKLSTATKKITPLLKVSFGQMKYEFEHLQKKLKKRTPKKYNENLNLKKIQPNQIFRICRGDREDWEKVK